MEKERSADDENEEKVINIKESQCGKLIETICEDEVFE